MHRLSGIVFAMFLGTAWAKSPPKKPPTKTPACEDAVIKFNSTVTVKDLVGAAWGSPHVKIRPGQQCILNAGTPVEDNAARTKKGGIEIIYDRPSDSGGSGVSSISWKGPKGKRTLQECPWGVIAIVPPENLNCKSFNKNTPLQESEFSETSTNYKYRVGEDKH